MNTNIVFFRGNAAAPARANKFKSNSNNVCDFRKVAQPQASVRDVLIAVWRTNPASGRLERHWTKDASAATGESVSCNGLLRRAA